MIDRPETKNRTVFMPNGQEMFEWADGIFRATPELKPDLILVKDVQIAPRDLTPAERGRYRTNGRILGRLLAGRVSDPRLVDKLIPYYASKEAIRQSSQELIRIASEGSKPKEDRNRRVIKESVENFLQAVGIRSAQVRRDLAALQAEHPIPPEASVGDIESSLNALNKQFPALTILEGDGRSWEKPNPSKAYQIHKGQLEAKRNELRAAGRKKSK